VRRICDTRPPPIKERGGIFLLKGGVGISLLEGGVVKGISLFKREEGGGYVNPLIM